jgi:hypothetical protein
MSEEEAHREHVMVRLTTVEKEDFGREARAMGIRTGTWLRVAGKEKLANSTGGKRT